MLGMCGVIWMMHYRGSYSIAWRSAFPTRQPALPPRINRCISLPFGLVGFFAAWLLGLWVIIRWNARDR